MVLTTLLTLAAAALGVDADFDGDTDFDTDTGDSEASAASEPAPASPPSHSSGGDVQFGAEEKSASELIISANGLGYESPSQYVTGSNPWEPKN